MLKIISCAGFGNTGSSIVTDFFQEFSCINVVGGSAFEFFFLHECDGIMDLENALTEGHRLKTDLAIKRFLKLVENLNSKNPSGPNYKDYFNGKFLDYTYKYLDSLGVVKWENGWWHRAAELKKENKIKRIVLQEKFRQVAKKYSYSLYETDSWKPVAVNYVTQYFCTISKKDFKEKTKNYLKNLLLELCPDNEWVLFDQLFPPSCNSEYLSYFDFAKVIIVDRDPRDLYFANKVFWGSGYIPSENPEVFIQWFEGTRSKISESENVISIKFEDMVYNFEKAQKMLCDFVGIDISLRDTPNTHLFLEKSKTNTLFFKRFCLADKQYEAQLGKDVKLIEEKLSNYIFRFSDFVDLNSITKKEQDFIFEKAVHKINNDVLAINPIKLIFSLCKIFIRKIKNGK